MMIGPIYGVWCRPADGQDEPGWAKDTTGRIYEYFSKGAAASMAREWQRHTTMIKYSAQAFGDDGFPEREEKAMAAG